MQISTLVLGEHEGGIVKPSCLSAISAAGSICNDNSISILLAGSGPSLQKAASHAASSHPSLSQVPLFSSIVDIPIFHYRGSFSSRGSIKPPLYF